MKVTGETKPCQSPAQNPAGLASATLYFELGPAIARMFANSLPPSVLSSLAAQVPPNVPELSGRALRAHASDGLGRARDQGQTGSCSDPVVTTPALYYQLRVSLLAASRVRKASLS